MFNILNVKHKNIKNIENNNPNKIYLNMLY